MNQSCKILILCLFLFLQVGKMNAVDDGGIFKEVEEIIPKMMKKGKIPGMSIVIIKGDTAQYINGFGYADIEKKTTVIPKTKFELASCSKSFTALAALQLKEKGLLNLDDTVSTYLPGFFAVYKKQEYEITIRQLLHHTSGIPWDSISKIPVDDGENALQALVRKLEGIELDSIPGERYHYATVNYDIVGAIIEKVTGKTFADYMSQRLFIPLGLANTSVGVNKNIPLKATGYKIGFSSPRKYNPPVYRGNDPAAYIVSNAEDMARWLNIQMGLIDTGFVELIRESHIPDLTVLPGRNFSSYAMGWIVNRYKDGEIKHAGTNPNFSAYIAIRVTEKTGIAILANSNSNSTTIIGDYIVRLLSGEKNIEMNSYQDKLDLSCSIISFVLGLFLLSTIIIIISRITGYFQGKNEIESLNLKKTLRLVTAIFFTLPYILGVYLLPAATLNVSWQTVFVWSPISTYIGVLLIIASFVTGFVNFLLTLILPFKKKYLNAIPMIVLVGILSGLANTSVLFLITTSFYSPMSILYLLYYFALAYFLYAFGTKIVAAKMIKMTNNITLDLRTELINKLMSTRYQNFEKLMDGRIFTTLDNDTAIVANSANLFIGAITNCITFISAFIYLTTISLKSTMIVLAVVVILSVYYYMVSKKSRRFFEAARNAESVYLSLLNGLIKGYQELSMHFKKNIEYREETIDSCKKFCVKSVGAQMKFLNSRIIGNSFIMIVLGTLSIVVPRLMTDINVLSLISFIMVLLYLLGPINGLLGVLPGLTRIRVSWGRIKNFIRDLNLQLEQDSVKKLIKRIDVRETAGTLKREHFNAAGSIVENIKVEGLMFEYKNIDKVEKFKLGPIDMELNKGDILFIIGGNGSGKTTLAKLLTGLYVPLKGAISINGQKVPITRLGEYYSTVFFDYHLFGKIYGVEMNKKETEAEKYLKTLNLDKKVQLEGDRYSTTNLSGGQRKRLALMQCFIEDSPIYLFDELAANQDPEFRKFFYRDLLVKIKEKGKIVIAITHDDHYFDAADKILKMDMGKIDFITNDYKKEMREGKLIEITSLKNPGKYQKDMKN